MHFYKAPFGVLVVFDGLTGSFHLLSVANRFIFEFKALWKIDPSILSKLILFYRLHPLKFSKRHTGTVDFPYYYYDQNIKMVNS